MGGGKAAATGIKPGQRPPFEEVGKHPLLGLPVGIESQLHQYQPRTIPQESGKECPVALGKADKGQQRVASGHRAVKIESVNPSHAT